MKAAIAAVLLTVSLVVQGQLLQVEFEAGGIHLENTSAGANGSWFNDITQHPTQQEIGANGLATGSGRAFSTTFGPINATTAGDGPWVSVRSRPSTTPPHSWTLTLYDHHGGSSSWTPDLSDLSQVQNFSTVIAEDIEFSGNLDWSAITQFSLSGNGGNSPFHTTFTTLQLAVPEPVSTSAFIGVLLVGFAAIWQRRGNRKPAS